MNYFLIIVTQKSEERNRRRTHNLLKLESKNELKYIFNVIIELFRLINGNRVE